MAVVRSACKVRAGDDAERLGDLKAPRRQLLAQRGVCGELGAFDVADGEGDEVELFGEHISLLEFARMCGTIPYEVLTSVSQRVKRVYVEG